MAYEISGRGRRGLMRYLEGNLYDIWKGKDGDFKISCEDGDLREIWKGKMVVMGAGETL